MPKLAATSKVLVDKITIEGRSVTLTGVDLPLERVRLDPRNPRLANSVLSAGLPTKDQEAFLVETLWSDSNVRELAKQIKANRGLTERILVTQDGLVIEGNCRTVVYRKLHQENPSDSAWRAIPARVLPRNVSERDIAILQGELHVAGKITWATFEKAGHVYRMHHDYMMTQDEISSRLRMSKSKVNQFIRAFETMQVKYLRLYPTPTSVRKFSYFEEFFKNPDLRNAAGRDPGLIDQFVHWVGSGKIPEGKHVRTLPDILRSPKAVRALDAGGYLAALKVIENDNPALTSELFRSIQRATTDLQSASATDIEEAQQGTVAARMIYDLRNSLTRFMRMASLEE